jgi:uncharacterized protein with HEPN domain
MNSGDRRDRFLVDEMLRHLAVVEMVTREGRTHLESSTTSRYALEHATELLGEAGETVSRPFKTANPAIPWDDLRKFRAEVAHPYDRDASRVAVDQLWTFARGDAPRIARQLRRA